MFAIVAADLLLDDDLVFSQFLLENPPVLALRRLILLLLSR
jgi:hypothetical protein